ncbi:uncharacterized protein H6S33_010005 [Morchella sextelata]|uniref:uncharacterized protein n=1 Tax=Morchella sextelata TaxID=1174677 RepID=UPI001D03AC6F|nr:uncharacterized protein H6S33_010005 [Morchella sextelata]KAH0611953.1 hypothetical protein H6S33_010005 [Morchella sextelata]
MASVSTWGKYPFGITRVVPCVDNLYQLRDVLEKRGEELFVDQESKVRLEVLHRGILWTPPVQDLQVASSGLSAAAEPHISSTAQLETFLKVETSNDKTSTKIFLIHQLNTWSRLKITFELFCLLCSSYSIFPKYLPFIFAFGIKDEETDRHFSGCSPRFHFNGDLPLVYELCYNIRYYAENGRGDEEFPWSCRHCAIYQQYSLQDDASVWVLVQVPLSAQEGLKRIVGEKGDAGHPMQLHLHFLVECERGWRGYVNCLGGELEKMSDRVRFRRINSVNFGVEFQHSQDIGVLRNRLSQALSILEANLDTALKLAAHYESLKPYRTCTIGADICFRTELTEYESALKGHIRSIKELLVTSEDIRLMILKVLDFRNDEAMEGNSSALRELAADAASENKLLVTLAEKTREESRFMGIATVVAMIYLPAGLVAALFSTSLVEISESSSLGGIVVRKQFWVFVLATMGLMVVTISAAWAWNCNSKKRSEQGKI